MVRIDFDTVFTYKGLVKVPHIGDSLNVLAQKLEVLVTNHGFSHISILTGLALSIRAKEMIGNTLIFQLSEGRMIFEQWRVGMEPPSFDFVQNVRAITDGGDVEFYDKVMIAMNRLWKTYDTSRENAAWLVYNRKDIMVLIETIIQLDDALDDWMRANMDTYSQVKLEADIDTFKAILETTEKIIGINDRANVDDPEAKEVIDRAINCMKDDLGSLKDQCDQEQLEEEAKKFIPSN